MARVPAMNGRREAIYLALAAGEACWVSALFLAFGRFVAPHPPLLLWFAMLILLAGYSYLYRALVLANVSLPVQQGLLVAILIVSIGLFLRLHVYATADLPGFQWLLEPFRRFADLSNVLSAELVLVMTLLYLWARGIHLARRSLSVEGVGFSFRAGVLIWIWTVPLIVLLGDMDPSGLVVGYFGFSLIAVALSRVEQVSQMPGSGRMAFSGFWIGSTLGAVAVLVVLGSLVAHFFYGGGLRQVLGWFSPLIVVLQVVILVVAWLFFGLLQLLFSWLELDWSALSERFQSIFDRLAELGQPIAQAPGGPVEPNRQILGALQAGTIVAVVAGLVLLVLFFTWWRVRRARGREGEEFRESLLSGRGLARSLLASLQAGRHRLGELAGLVDRFGLGLQLLSAISIRRMYANLVRLATRAGYPRSRSQTPYEYLAVLGEALPGNREDARVITEAYVNAHYGQVPDSGVEMEHIHACWERIRAQGIKRR